MVSFLCHQNCPKNTPNINMLVSWKVLSITTKIVCSCDVVYMAFQKRSILQNFIASTGHMTYHKQLHSYGFGEHDVTGQHDELLLHIFCHISYVLFMQSFILFPQNKYIFEKSFSSIFGTMNICVLEIGPRHLHLIWFHSCVLHRRIISNLHWSLLQSFRNFIIGFCNLQSASH